MPTPAEKELPQDVLSSMTEAAKSLGIDTGDNTDSAPAAAPTQTPPAAGTTDAGDGGQDGAGAAGGDPEKLLSEQGGEKPVEGDDGEAGEGEAGKDKQEPTPDSGKKTEKKEDKKETESDPEIPDTTGAKKEEKKVEKKEDKPSTQDRDKDLDFPENQHQSPKTKKIIETLKTAAKQARDERDAATAKLQTELKQLRESVEKGSGMPPEMKKNYDQYKEMVRQLQIERDPEIVEKFDNRMTSNTKRVCDILSQFGLGTDSEGKKIEGYMEKLVAQGKVTIKDLAPTIKKLEEAGEIEAAEEIRAALLENVKLGRERVSEIESYKKDFEGRQAKAQETQQRMIAEATERFKGEIVKDIKDLGEAFPELKRPPEPTDTDDEGTKAAKLKAIETWQTELGGIMKKIESISQPDDAAENVRFRTAIQGLILRDALVPRMRNQIKSLKAQLDAQAATLGKFKKAGSLPSNSTAKPGNTKPASGRDQGQYLNGEDAIIQAAKGLGINVDSE